jgi:hypothetical protein
VEFFFRKFIMGGKSCDDELYEKTSGEAVGVNLSGCAKALNAGFGLVNQLDSLGAGLTDGVSER